MQHHAALREGEHRHLRLLHLRRGGDHRIRERRRGDQPPRDLRPQDGQASRERRAVVGGVRGRSTCSEIAHRHAPPVGIDDVAGKHVRHVPARPGERRSGPSRVREIRRRIAISAAVGSPSISLIATTALPGSEPTMTAPASPPVESVERELGRSLAGRPRSGAARLRTRGSRGRAPTTWPIPSPNGISGTPRRARARESPAGRRPPSGSPPSTSHRP